MPGQSTGHANRDSAGIGVAVEVVADIGITMDKSPRVRIIVEDHTCISLETTTFS